jgi:hypothetical protein
MARVGDAERYLQQVSEQLLALKAASTHQEECTALSELLEASRSILQYWQSSSIHDAKVKSAGGW